MPGKGLTLTSSLTGSPKTASSIHPGPILRGLDVSDALADSSQSLILDQVSAGVSVRMAVLYLLATRPDIKDNL